MPEANGPVATLPELPAAGWSRQVAIQNRSARRKLLNGCSCILPLVCLAAVASPAPPSSGIWDPAWGKDAGGPGGDICTLPTNGQAGNTGTPGGESHAPPALPTAPSP